MSKKISFWFIVAVVLKQLMWIAFIPIWQFPDEQAHFGQVQNYAEGNPIKSIQGNNMSREIDESEKLLGTKRDDFGNNLFTYHPEYNIPYSSTKYGIFEQTIRNFDSKMRKEAVTNEATVYPPLYYRLSALLYLLSYPYDLLTRVFFARLINLIIFIALLGVVYATGKLVFPRNQLLQLTFSILVLFHPMLSFVAGGISSDNLFNLSGALIIYLSLRLLCFGWKLLEVFLNLVVLWITFFTKPQAKVLPLFYLFPAVDSFMKWKKFTYTFLVLAVILSLTFKYSIENFLQNAQFIPEIPAVSQLPPISLSGYLHHWIQVLHKMYRETIPWYWGVFRWLSLTYPRLVHRIINWILVLSTAGLGVYVIRFIHRQKLVIAPSLLLFFIFTAIVYTGALVTFDYLFTVSHGFSFGFQGRYFFPTISAHMLLILVGITTLVPDKFRLVLTQCLGAAMVVLHSYAFWFVISSYYTTSSLRAFFIQANQYKPEFLKSPFLEVLVIANLASLMLFLFHFLRIPKSASKN